MCELDHRAQVTLDSNNDFTKFCPPADKDGNQNPRLSILNNFKEISRIMTQNFLTHKKLESRYEKTAIPRSELLKMREEERAQERMTGILKQMHSPRNFASPARADATSVNRSMMSSGFKGQLAASAKVLKQSSKTEANWMKPVKTQPGEDKIK